MNPQPPPTATPAVSKEAREAAIYNVVRWHKGRIVINSNSSASRHLYLGNLWVGSLCGMTDEDEQRIVDALNADRECAALKARVAELEKALIRIQVMSAPRFGWEKDWPYDIADAALARKEGRGT